MLEGKVCLITGGTRGIGRAIADLFVENHAQVYITGRSLEGAAGAEERNGKQGSRIKQLTFDIADEKQCFAAVSQIKKDEKHLDILVNNAGIEYNERIGMISRVHMEEMFSVNVFGAIQMLQLAARIMGRQENGGSIINISSVVGVQGNAGQVVYSATKGALISVTKSAAKELAPQKIRVNSIAPGLTNTEMIRKTDPLYLQKRIERIAFGNPADPEDIANACLFLASDKAKYISGQILSVDGCTSL